MPGNLGLPMIPAEMTKSDYADANLVASVRAFARWQSPCEIAEQEGLLLHAGPTRFPASCINAAIRVNAKLDPQQALSRAREFFGARGRGFTFITRIAYDTDLETLLAAEGLTRDSDSPCMLVDAPVRVPALREGLRIEMLREARHVADHIAISAAAYQAMGLPLEQTQAAFSNVAGVLDERTAGFIAYRGDRPVSTALTIFSGTGATLGAGIYWVGTVPDARGLGLAEHCTALATNIGFDRGAHIVTLQASKFGEPIYRRMGYRDYDRQSWYRHASPNRK
jgi:ribosomal protein S18 acetylase RimI-like enzyme